MSSKKKLSDNEIEDLLDMYWLLLRTVEANARDTDTIDKHTVEGAYSILRRLKFTKAYARWQTPQPETVQIKKGS